MKKIKRIFAALLSAAVLASACNAFAMSFTGSRIYTQAFTKTASYRRVAAGIYDDRFNLLYGKTVVDYSQNNIADSTSSPQKLTDGDILKTDGDSKMLYRFTSGSDYLTFDLEEAKEVNEIVLYAGGSANTNSGAKAILDTVNPDMVSIYVTDDASYSSAEWTEVTEAVSRELLVSGNGNSSTVSNLNDELPMQQVIYKFPTMTARYIKIEIAGGRGHYNDNNVVRLFEVEAYKKNETSFIGNLLGGKGYDASGSWQLGGTNGNSTALTNGDYTSTAANERWSLPFSDANKQTYINGQGMPRLQYNFDEPTQMNQFVIIAGNETNTSEIGVTNTGTTHNDGRAVPHNIHIVYSDDNGSTWKEAKNMAWQMTELIGGVNNEISWTAYKPVYQMINIFTNTITADKIRIYADEGYGVVKAAAADGDGGYILTYNASSDEKSVRIRQIEAYNNPSVSFEQEDAVTIYAVNGAWLSTEPLREKRTLNGSIEIFSAVKPIAVKDSVTETEKADAAEKSIAIKTLTSNYEEAQSLITVVGGGYSITQDSADPFSYIISDFEAGKTYSIYDSANGYSVTGKAVTGFTTYDAVEINSKAFSEQDGKISVTLNADIYKDINDVLMYIAVYDGDKLESVGIGKYSLERGKGQNLECETTLSGTSEGKDIRVFMWDTDMTPVMSVISK